MIQDKNTVFIIAFGNHLRLLRKKKKLTQEQLAIDTNVPISQIGRIERGEINTTLSTLYNLSKALEIPLSKLVDIEYQR